MAEGMLGGMLGFASALNNRNELLASRRQILREQPALRGRDLYAHVIGRLSGLDPEASYEILERAHESCCRWPVDRNLRIPPRWGCARTLPSSSRVSFRKLFKAQRPCETNPALPAPRVPAGAGTDRTRTLASACSIPPFDSFSSVALPTPPSPRSPRLARSSARIHYWFDTREKLLDAIVEERLAAHWRATDHAPSGVSSRSSSSVAVIFRSWEYPRRSRAFTSSWTPQTCKHFVRH